MQKGHFSPIFQIPYILWRFDLELLQGLFDIRVQPFNDYPTIYTITQSFTRLLNHLHDYIIWIINYGKTAADIFEYSLYVK